MTTTLHDHIMSIIKRNIDTQSDKATTPNNVRQPKPNEKFRMSYVNYGVALSRALCAQLDRYCEANPTTPKTKTGAEANPRPMTRSKVIRRAVYELMAAPTKMHQTPNKLPTRSLPPSRPHDVSWTMPQNRLEDAKHLYALCSHHGVSNATFVRRAIYIYTKAHISTNKDEAIEAAQDGWA